MRIPKDKAAGLIIDMQERLFPFISEKEKLVKNVQVLIEGLRILGIPLFVTEQYPKGLGSTIDSIASVTGGVERHVKTAFSCCDEPTFMEDLALSGRDYAIIAGIESHICVMQTALDMLAHGMHPVVVEDCVSSRNLNDKAIAIERMRRAGVIITTMESILFELLRYSGTENFKMISKLIK